MALGKDDEHIRAGKSQSGIIRSLFRSTEVGGPHARIAYIDTRITSFIVPSCSVDMIAAKTWTARLARRARIRDADFKEHMMKSSMGVSLAIGLGVVGCLAFATWAGNTEEENVTLDQVPAAVKATILKEAAGAEIKEIERETKGGKTVYEAEFLLEGEEIEIEVASDGTLLGREVEQDSDDQEDEEDAITINQVPAPAREALIKLAGNARITKAEREEEDGVQIYEAAWVANGTEHEASVTEDGTLIEMEETIPAEKIPASIRAVIAKHFGANAKVVVEKKMIVVYEVEGTAKGEREELLVLPTGRVIEDADDDDDEDEGEDNDDGDEGDDD